MKFKYSARTKEGEMQTGFIEAGNQKAAVNILTGHDLYILSLEGAEKVSWFGIASKFLNRVKTVDLMVFTRQFATLLSSEVPLGDAIRNLNKQTRNVILKEAATEITADINAGLSLSQALERPDTIFSEFYISMIRSAEITGRLEAAMSFLADYLEKEGSWQSKIRNAMIYPMFIVSLFLVVAIMLITVVFPKLNVVFEETGTSMPLITRILLGSGNFIINWWWLIILITFFLISLIMSYLKTPEGKNVKSELIIKIPVFGNLFKKIYIARFADSLSILIKGGIPVAQSIEITGHTIGNIIYRDILHEISEKIKEGETLSALLSTNEYYFPAMVGQMVAVGETTGRLEEILAKISVFYTRDVDNALDNLTELIQPVLITVIGIFIGLLFAAVLLPIYNLMQGFKTF